MVHTMENTSVEQLNQLDPRQRFVAFNGLICDLLWAFTESNNPSKIISEEAQVFEFMDDEAQVCKSVVDSVDPNSLELLRKASRAERRSAMNDQLDKHNRNTLQKLCQMVVSRLPIAFSQTGSNTENSQGEEISGKIGIDHDMINVYRNRYRGRYEKP